MEQRPQSVNHHSHLEEWSRRVEVRRKSGQRVSEWCRGKGARYKINIDTPFAVSPTVPGRQFHPVQQQVVEGHGFYEESAVTRQEGLGNTEKAGLKTFVSVKIIHFVCHF